jgi:glycosyltransferase involved in cell wall biosynthesis
MKKRILFACNAYPPSIGGAEKVCKNAVDILSEKYDVTVLTQPHSERKNMPNVIELQGKTVYSYMPGLKDFLDNNSFDLYISFGYGKYFSDTIMKWCAQHNKKSIYMPCGGFHTTSNKLFKQLYGRFIGGIAFRKATTIITATEWEKQHWLKKYNRVFTKKIPSSKIQVAPYNLENDFTKFKSTNILKNNKLDKKKYLLYIGRTGPNKLIELLMKSYFETEQKLPLIIAGKGTEKYKEIIDFAKSGILCNIKILGTVSEDDKKTLIKNAKLCIFPSSYESFGMVLLEATALGTPVIGSDIGSFKELLEEKYLFKNNIEDLTKKLNEIYTKNPNVIKIKLPNYKKALLKIIGDIIE